MKRNVLTFSGVAFELIHLIDDVNDAEHKAGYPAD